MNIELPSVHEETKTEGSVEAQDELLTSPQDDARKEVPEAVIVHDVEEGGVVRAVLAAPEMRQSDVPEAPIVYQAVAAVKERPRSCCAGTGCLLVLLVILLVFLLTPRSPTVRLRDIDLMDQVAARVRFESNSLVESDWRNLDLDLDWRSEDFEVFTVARLRRDDRFTTEAFGTRNFKILTEDVDNDDLPLLRALCQEDGSAVLRLRGDVRSANSKLNLNSPWTSLSC